MAEIKPLSAELQKVAIEELGEVPSRIPDDLLALKTWIQQQPHLKACTDDQFLIQFLRGSKYSLEKAKKKLDYFYTFRTKFPIFGGSKDMDSRKFQDILNGGYWIMLPTPLNECGPRIAMLRINYPTEKFTFEDIVEPGSAIMELSMLSDPYACIYGVVYIIDIAHGSYNHLLQATPTFLKRLTTFYAKAIPLRIRAIYYINVATAAVKVIATILQLFPEKLRQKIFVCGTNVESIAEHIPLKYIPQDYGGENGCLQQLNDKQQKLLHEHREYFKQSSEYGCNEITRPEIASMDFDDILGCGSFRKLDVD